MTATIKPLGMTEAEIQEAEKMGVKWRKDARRSYIEMREMPRPTDSDIGVLEKNFGRIPEDYRAFLLKFNGGSPVPSTIVTPENERVVDCFLPIKHPRGYTENVYDVFETFGERIPSDMLPIATAGGGDLILIQLGPSDFGKIYYWDHSWESEDDASAYFDNIELIAGSFDELLERFVDVDALC